MNEFVILLAEFHCWKDDWEGNAFDWLLVENLLSWRFLGQTPVDSFLSSPLLRLVKMWKRKDKRHKVRRFTNPISSRKLECWQWGDSKKGKNSRAKALIRKVLWRRLCVFHEGSWLLGRICLLLTKFLVLLSLNGFYVTGTHFSIIFLSL